MKAVRIYYDIGGNIVYHIGLEGTGDFPKTIEQELSELPEGTSALTIIDPVIIESYYRKENNTVVNDELVLGDDLPPPPPPEPPSSTHLSTLVSVTAGAVRPASIKRVWHGIDYFYDCYVTQTVKDEYISGKIVIGDYVLVHFDNELNEQIVTAKVYKSW